MLVSNVPGAIATHRIRRDARSRATGSVSDAMAPFDDAYAAWPICPSNAAMLAVLTITPRSPSSGSCPAVRCAARRVTLNVPTTFTWSTLAKMSRSCGPSRPTVRPAHAMPAQFTTM